MASYIHDKYLYFHFFITSFYGCFTLANSLFMYYKLCCLYLPTFSMFISEKFLVSIKLLMVSQMNSLLPVFIHNNSYKQIFMIAGEGFQPQLRQANCIVTCTQIHLHVYI